MNQRANGSTIPTGRLVVNLDTRVVSVDDQPVHLTGKEYGILELLSLRKGTTLTKEMFLNHLYGGMDEPELKIIDVFVCKLRKKLAQATGVGRYIETIWGRGYVLRDPPWPWCRGHMRRAISGLLMAHQPDAAWTRQRQGATRHGAAGSRRNRADAGASNWRDDLRLA
jgi:DNA-binding winged helix-turn-helix (wHTH) protein